MDSIASAKSSTGTVAPDAGSNSRLLDVDVTLSRFAGDETLLGEIACVFIRTVPQLVTSISSALTARDLKSAFHHAHSLKGAVAAFEAPAVLNAVKELEGHAKSSDGVATAAAFPVAQAFVERMLAELAPLARSDRGLDAQR